MLEFLPGIAEDPKLWADPCKFNPDRFMSGQKDADITAVTGIKMIRFGAGRRICPDLRDGNHPRTFDHSKNGSGI